MARHFHYEYIIKESQQSNLVSDFLNFQPLPELMQGAGVAVLTLLISFAIGIFIHHLSDGERKNNFLDLHVALDYVWRFKQSVAILLGVVLSPMLMGIGGNYFKFIIFLIWLCSLVALLAIIFRLYSWIKGDKDEFRKSYLSDFKKTPDDQVVSWSDLWGTEVNKEKKFLEKDYFVPFSNQIDLLIVSDQESDWDTLSKLLDSYANNLELRNKTFLLVFDEFFPKILEWHQILWVKQYSEFGKTKTTPKQVPSHHVFNVDQTISKMIKYVTKEALVGVNGRAYSYFKTLENHFDKYRDVQIEGAQHSYIYIKYIPVYEDCLNLISKSQEAYNIWSDYFPHDWKITKENYKQNVVTQEWYSRFISWSQEKIWKENKEWNKELEEVSRELFPSVDPITWAKIYTFALMGHSETRVKKIIERGVSYGYGGRVFTGSGDDFEKDFAALYEAEVNASLDLALFLFGRVYTEKNLNNWLIELNNHNYEENSNEFKRKVVWTQIFKRLLEKINNI